MVVVNLKCVNSSYITNTVLYYYTKKNGKFSQAAFQCCILPLQVKSRKRAIPSLGESIKLRSFSFTDFTNLLRNFCSDKLRLLWKSIGLISVDQI